MLLRQVLIGLLTNAFKNTPRPAPLRFAPVAGRTSEVLIEVSDTGTGIARGGGGACLRALLPRLGSLEQEGFGLGLSIAKRMVDVMGGEIGVESGWGSAARSGSASRGEARRRPRSHDAR